MTLPPNFGFAWNNRIAGAGHPGAGGQLSRRLDALRRNDIQAVLSLTEEPLELAPLREFDMEYLHLPIDDFSAPTAAQVQEAVQFLDAQIEKGRGVLVHCRAGVGRTGTILACFLVGRGLEPDAAIKEVRRLRPGSIEVYAQEFCVHQYARAIKRKAPPAGEQG